MAQQQDGSEALPQTDAPREAPVPSVVGVGSTGSTGGGLRQRPALRQRSGADCGSGSDDEQVPERKKHVKKWVRRLDWLWRNLLALFWVGAAVLMIWYTNFFRVIWESPLVNRPYFDFAMTCLAFNICTLFYLAIWCATIKGIPEPWETHNPRAIPVMMVMGFSTFILLFFALWPVWGFMTLAIQIVFFLGFVNAGHFLPSGPIGSVLMFCILFGAFFTSEMIPHEGLAHYTPKPTTVAPS